MQGFGDMQDFIIFFCNVPKVVNFYIDLMQMILAINFEFVLMLYVRLN